MTTQPQDDQSGVWWRDWFNDIYLDVYAHRDDASAEREAQAAAKTLALQAHEQILDLCCGNGRHCRALKRLGFEHVAGVDYSYPLLRFGQSEKPRARYVRGDMRLLPLRDASFDALVTFFTSFGYFKTNIENLKVFQETRRILKPGGRFLIDYLNPDHVRAHFEPESERKHGEYCIRETRSFTDDGERVEKEIVIENWGGEVRTYHESVRLYSYPEICDMLASADLAPQGVFGDFSGAAFDASQPRMIVWGTA
ncbi:MAG: class I SAM-dependent methyltransferase [Candidatus Hinthialibacter antarcticus]|nr:class I SAM-dependent methyltransferase [Candidatus Hinthialibacter antarcticus]